MDATLYQNTPFGRPARRPGESWAFTYYLPNKMPRQLELTAGTILALS